MSHFAKIKDGFVQQIIVAEQDFIDSGVVGNPSDWIQTSYNTRNGVHYDPVTNEPDGKPALRWKYASIGDMYLAEKDIFVTAKPWDSWTFDDNTNSWVAPIPMPNDDKKYYWNEQNKEWIEFNI